MIPPLTIHDVFSELTEHCTELKGAAVATPEGLMLAATGAFDGDVPAACAAGLAANIDSHLSFVTPSRFNDSLIWTDSGIWHLTRLPYGHLLLIWSSPEEHVGRLRIATHRAAQQLVPMLCSMK
ncbi:hypothetical protein PI87_27110 [Ralstonia sp. A12]|uniref:hypothetical protein n=1 Tax=Ralstonia sp. A12 TaxID=1217052 RepID=UPI000573436A|nr:hypothetical protein [Ralstonia sp. A12]KHK49127.1 hypothetical protein PI87_27110 [Ralstonia sp. A12]